MEQIIKSISGEKKNEIFRRLTCLLFLNKGLISSKKAPTN